MLPQLGIHPQKGRLFRLLGEQDKHARAGGLNAKFHIINRWYAFGGPFFHVEHRPQTGRKVLVTRGPLLAKESTYYLLLREKNGPTLIKHLEESDRTFFLRDGTLPFGKRDN